MKTQHAIARLTFVLFAVLLAALTSRAQEPRGSLFIIGGGERTADLMREFVAMAGGPAHARIVVIPNASGDPDTACIDMTQEFHGLGVQDVRCLYLTREQAMKPESAQPLDGATAVYFTGGDQVRVTQALLGTPVYKKLHDLYRNGAVLGGTSAGAAIMSEVMITGDERRNKDTVRNFRYIRKDNVVTVEGMGFITSAIIDQHFVARKRHNRLISVVLEHPNLIGVGIDESTAIIVRGGRTFDVAGEGDVIVYDARHATDVRADTAGTLAGANLSMHVLSAGDSYNLTTYTVAPRKANK